VEKVEKSEKKTTKKSRLYYDNEGRNEEWKRNEREREMSREG